MVLKGKTLLITGGTGSFGNAMINKMLSLDLREVRIFSRDEKKQDDMRNTYRSSVMKYFIGDVRDLDSLDNVMQGVDYVFHAAALKQVPSCEFYPMEAVKTNIIGTQNVIESAYKHSVSKVVVLSTDKAVYPINAMGLSKALAEKIMVAKSRTKGNNTICCATRYGNVMGSRGSVIPLFVKRIQESKTLPVTDPSMTRFLMSLEESVELVLYAFENAKQGDIFVQKAPASTIEVLARGLCKMMNYPCRLQVVGTRHGEKLYESLISREEMSRVEDHGSFFRIPLDDRDLNYDKYFSIGEVSISLLEDYTSHNTHRLEVDEVIELLRRKRVLEKVLC